MGPSGRRVVSGSRPPSRGFSLVEVIAVLVVAGLMTGLAAVSLRGVTQAERLDDAADRLRLLDERVRALAEREHRPWRIDLTARGATARPADAGDSAEDRVLEVTLGDRLELEPWSEADATAPDGVRIRVNVEGASHDYGWSVRRSENTDGATVNSARTGRFAGRTGQFSEGPQPPTRGGRRG